MSLIAKNFIRLALESVDGTPPPTALALAKKLHQHYEDLASAHNYETREDTKVFDPESPNGKLMIAVCQKLIDEKTISVNDPVVPTDEPPVETPTELVAETPPAADTPPPEAPVESTPTVDPVAPEATPPTAEATPVEPTEPAADVAPAPEVTPEVTVNPPADTTDTPEASPNPETAEAAVEETAGKVDQVVDEVHAATDAAPPVDGEAPPVETPPAAEDTPPPAEEPAATPADGSETPPPVEEGEVVPEAEPAPAAAEEVPPQETPPAEVPEATTDETPPADTPAEETPATTDETPPVAEEPAAPPVDGSVDAPAAPEDATPPAEEPAPTGDEAPPEGDVPAPAGEEPVAADLPANPSDTPAAADSDVPPTEGTAETPTDAPATTPDPVQDAHTEVTAVQQAADLASKAEEAANANEVVNEFNSAKNSMVDAYDTAQAVNDSGGFTQESFQSMQTCFEHLTRVMGIRTPLKFGDISVESFADGKREVVSLEHVAAIVDAIKAGSPDLEKKALDALSSLSDSLSVALPSARNRLGAVVNAACQAQSDGAGTVAIDGNLKRLLSVNGNVPPELPTYVKDYVNLGQALLKTYAPASLATASLAPTLPEAFVGDSVEELHKKIVAKIDEIGDPRTQLSSTQLEMTLPGEVKLFETIPCDESANVAQSKFNIYCCNYVPTDPGEFMDMVSENSQGEAQESYKPLTRDQIKTIAADLNLLYDILDIPLFNETRKGVFTSMISTALSLSERMENGPQHLLQEFGGLQKTAQCYLSTVYSLSVWPTYHFLLNLIYTTNAFIVLAQRSLISEEAAPQEPAAPDAEPEAPAETPDAKVEDETPPADAPATDAPAEPESTEVKE